jgi:hypothetical protein
MAGHVEQRRGAHADPAQQRRRTSRPHGPAGQRTPYQHRAGRRHVTGARRRRPTSRSLGTPSGTTNHQDAACLTIRNGGHRRCGGDRRLAGGAVPRDCAPEIQIYDTDVGANAPGSIHTSCVSHSFQCDGWLQRLQALVDRSNGSYLAQISDGRINGVPIHNSPEQVGAIGLGMVWFGERRRFLPTSMTSSEQGIDQQVRKSSCGLRGSSDHSIADNVM